MDELRDRIKETVGAEVPTATWNVKRDTFLKGIDAVIQALEKPTIVSAEKFKEAQEPYQAALNEITERDQGIKELNRLVIWRNVRMQHR